MVDKEIPWEVRKENERLEVDLNDGLTFNIQPYAGSLEGLIFADYEEGFVSPTFNELISLLYGALKNIKDKSAKKVLEAFFSAGEVMGNPIITSTFCFGGENGAYVKDKLGMERVYCGAGMKEIPEEEANPENSVTSIKTRLDKENLEKELKTGFRRFDLHFSLDSSTRFIPREVLEKFYSGSCCGRSWETTYDSIKCFLEDPRLIAIAGETECLEKLGEIAGNVFISKIDIPDKREKRYEEYLRRTFKISEQKARELADSMKNKKISDSHPELYFSSDLEGGTKEKTGIDRCLWSPSCVTLGLNYEGVLVIRDSSIYEPFGRNYIGFSVKGKENVFSRRQKVSYYGRASQPIDLGGGIQVIDSS